MNIFKTLLLLAGLSCGCAWGQIAQGIQPVVSDPTGACFIGVPSELNTSVTPPRLWVCAASGWQQVGTVGQPYAVSETAMTSVTISEATHSNGTTPYVLAYDSTGTAVDVGIVNAGCPSACTGNLTLTFSPAFTGIVIVGSSGTGASGATGAAGPQGIPGSPGQPYTQFVTSVTSVTVNETIHNQGITPGVFAYNSSGNAVSGSINNSGCPSACTGNLTITFSPAFTGLLVIGSAGGSGGYIISNVYNFAPQQPGGTLTGGTPATVTLTPGPPGISGSEGSYYIYLSGGTGAAEAPLVTGGSCTGLLLTSCTVSFTPANSHSGAWQVSSASGGVKEALVYCAATGQGGVFVPRQAVVYALLDISDNCALFGQGMNVSNLYCQMLSRCVQWIGATANGAFVNFRDIAILYASNGTSQEGVYVQDAADGDIHNLIIQGPYDVMTLRSVAHLFVHEMYGGALHNGINLNSNPASIITTGSYPQLNNIHLVGPANSGNALNLTSILTGPQMSNMFLEQFAYCINATDSSGYGLNEVNFQGTCDNYGTAGIIMNLSGGSASLRWIIHDSLINGTGDAIILEDASAGQIGDFSILNNTIGFTGGQGIYISGINGGKIVGNNIYYSTTGTVGTALQFSMNAASNVNISGNQIGGGGGSTSGGVINDLYIDAATHSAIYISSNHFYPASGATITDLHNGSGLIEWDSNMGVNDVVPSVASTAALPIPVNPDFNVTGTTTVTSFAGPTWPGRRVTIFYPAGGSITILGHTISSPTSLSLTWNGSGWY